MKPAKLSYTISEASSATGISRRTLYRLMDAGKLDVSKIGSRVLILAASLQAMLEAGRKEFIGQK
jgi:excisionase family DNA binding protein